MLKFFAKLVSAALLTGSVASLSFAEEKVPAEVVDSIHKSLKSARSDLEYGDVTQSPVPGLYMVQIEQGPLLYVTADGKFALPGPLYGVNEGGFVDMQDLAMRPIRAEQLDAVSKDKELIFAAEGETKAHIYVFTDVDCGYCRKLHKEVPTLNAMGVEVRYLAFPRAGVDSESFTKIATAWCAEDPQSALTKLKNGGSIKANVCKDNPVAEQFALGNDLGVQGTPAIILADGTLLPGYMPADALMEQIQAHQ